LVAQYQFFSHFEELFEHLSNQLQGVNLRVWQILLVDALIVRLDGRLDHNYLQIDLKLAVIGMKFQV
jgi:hypothetical protein